MNMPTVGCVGESIIGNDERGLWFLSHKDDPSQMNWVCLLYTSDAADD